MKVAIISRSTLLTAPGGDSIQVNQTARHLRTLGVHADVLLTHEKIDYKTYDAFHFFNLIRPADILRHLNKIDKPIFLTPILVDYSEYDRLHRGGMSGTILRMFSPDGKEYIKTMGRAFTGKDNFPPLSYILKGQKKSIIEILKRTRAILPNSSGEIKALKSKYGIEKDHVVVPNGIDIDIFRPELVTKRSSNPNGKNVLCVARIEGIKNQLNLVKALNNTEFNLTLIGKASPSQKHYYNECRRIAADNVQFIDHIPQEELVQHYLDADVHVLPSWFETCGLSSLEAAAMGCKIVITDKGYASEYFGDRAFYCVPDSTQSILAAIRVASLHPSTITHLHRPYSWLDTAKATVSAYQKFLS